MKNVYLAIANATKNTKQYIVTAKLSIVIVSGHRGRFCHKMSAKSKYTDYRKGVPVYISSINTKALLQRACAFKCKTFSVSILPINAHFL